MFSPDPYYNNCTWCQGWVLRWVAALAEIAVVYKLTILLDNNCTSLNCTCTGVHEAVQQEYFYLLVLFYCIKVLGRHPRSPVHHVHEATALRASQGQPKSETVPNAARTRVRGKVSGSLLFGHALFKASTLTEMSQVHEVHNSTVS